MHGGHVRRGSDDLLQYRDALFVLLCLEQAHCAFVLGANFGSDTQPPDQFERKERVKALVEQICVLPEQERGAIVLQELEGHSTDEIAAELGVKVAVVGQLVFRARKRLRKAELSRASLPQRGNP